MNKFSSIRGFFLGLYSLDEMEEELKGYKKANEGAYARCLLRDCREVIELACYEKLLKGLAEDEWWAWKPYPHATELLLKYIVNRLTDTPTEMTLEILSMI